MTKQTIKIGEAKSQPLYRAGDGTLKPDSPCPTDGAILDSIVEFTRQEGREDLRVFKYIPRYEATCEEGRGLTVDVLWFVDVYFQ